MMNKNINNNNIYVENKQLYKQFLVRKIKTKHFPGFRDILNNFKGIY